MHKGCEYLGKSELKDLDKMVIIGPLIDPEEGLVKKLENVEMKINQTQMNAGTLYITEKYAQCFIVVVVVVVCIDHKFNLHKLFELQLSPMAGNWSRRRNLNSMAKYNIACHFK